ncbi:hypothetical protein ABZS83_34285, partial [Streptomyces sp. NPDC005426]
QAGKDVTFLVRPRRAAALRERGLRITGLGAQPVRRAGRLSPVRSARQPSPRRPEAPRAPDGSGAFGGKCPAEGP